MKIKTSLYNGIINVYKEKGFTSFDAVALIRKYFRSKTGHTGTLDPNAEGVLPVCLGKATKLCDYIMDKSKEYIAGIKLGVVTDTQDATGTVISQSQVSVASGELSAVLGSFSPGYIQVPPMYSAIKINGKKLYELARKGQEIERAGRYVAIDNIELLEYDGCDELKIRVSCSKGTYIRSLAHDIGQKLGCGAHMSSLTRTRSGSFCIENSHRLEELKKISESDFGLESVLIPMEDVLSEYRHFYVVEDSDKYLKNGNAISSRQLIGDFVPDPGESVLLYDSSGKLYGIYLALQENGRVVLRSVTLLYSGDE